MKNIVLTIQFDGTAYHGWQRQKNALTVQQVVEQALCRITGRQTAVVGCGRTDAGVHALKYVCNFYSDTKIPTEKLSHAINSVLPPDIRCLRAVEADLKFDARRSAIAKRYRYVILNRYVADALLVNRAWHWKYPLDFSKMQSACRHFIGEHDFSSFCATGSGVEDKVRKVYSLDMAKKNECIVIDIYGNGFLRHMVRNIAGTLVYVGAGKIDVDNVPRIILARDRKLAGVTAPPQGLYLMEVYYESRF